MSTCRPCKNPRPLVESHIIPKSFWPLKDDNRSPLIGPLAIVDNVNFRPEPSRKGPYDKTILCEECDVALGQLDQHAAEKLLRGKRHSVVQLFGCRVLRYPDANPDIIIKFLASVAWRASKSSYKYFDRVKLGPYEDQLKKIFDWQANDRQSLECMIAEFDQADVPQLNPTYTRLAGIRFLVLYANRFIFYLKVDKKPTPSDLQGLMLKEGRPVHSLVMTWSLLKEAKIMKKLAIKMPSPSFWKPR